MKALFNVVVLLLLLFSAQVKALKIIALSPHTTEMLFELNLADSIIATVDYADFPEQAKKIIRVGGSYGLSIEKIVALQPDYIVAWRRGNKAADLAKLEQLGFQIIDSSPQSLAQVANDYRRLGKLFNRHKEAEIIASDFEKTLTAIVQEFANKPRIPSFYQMWPEPMMTINQTTWTHQLMESCGASNVFASQNAAYPQVSIENIMIKQPELIIVPMEKGVPTTPTEFWQNWQQIPAVKNKRYVEADANLLHRFTSRMLIGLAKLCADIDRYR